VDNIPIDFGINEMPEREGGDRDIIIDDPGTNRNERRTSRVWKPTQRYLEGIQQESIALPIALQASCYDDEHETIIDDVNPMSLLSKTDGDTMYWDQAIRQHDSEQFIKAAMDEIMSHQQNKHWEVVERSQVPPDTPVLDAYGV
jgi:hypothetical protein